ncbi:hypothetical protein GCM10023107_87590 [Actinoplanes octamycinicus]|nr:hypothetical protein Aoc01nite_79380 [Actinoplanes octamycinicus]
METDTHAGEVDRGFGAGQRAVRSVPVSDRPGMVLRCGAGRRRGRGGVGAAAVRVAAHKISARCGTAGAQTAR